MSTSVSLAEWVAISLGVVAVLIAVWDHVRNDYYNRRRAGPAKCVVATFDIPQPEVRVHVVGPLGTQRSVGGTQIRVVWEFRNHLSWPLYASFTIRSRLPPGSFVSTDVWDERNQSLGPAIFLPARQPVRRTLWMTVAEGSAGGLEPIVYLQSRRDVSVSAGRRLLRWIDGTPVLEA